MAVTRLKTTLVLGEVSIAAFLFTYTSVDSSVSFVDNSLYINSFIQSFFSQQVNAQQCICITGPHSIITIIINDFLHACARRSPWVNSLQRLLALIAMGHFRMNSFVIFFYWKLNRLMAVPRLNSTLVLLVVSMPAFLFNCASVDSSVSFVVSYNSVDSSVSFADTSLYINSLIPGFLSTPSSSSFTSS